MHEQKKQRIFSLKRCYFQSGSNQSLENIVREITKAFPNSADRVYPLELFKSYVINDVYDEMENNNDQGVHINIYRQEDNSAGVINWQNQSQAELLEYDAPEDSSWLDDHISLYIVDNHIIACNLGSRDTFINKMLSHFGEKAGVIADDTKMAIADVPNKTEIDKVKEVGVKEIDINLYSYLCSMEDLSETSLPIWLEKLFGTPSSPKDIKCRSSARARLSVTRGGKFTKSEVPKDEWLTDIGVSMMEDDEDDYKLILEDGREVSTSKLKVSKRFHLSSYANTHSEASARMTAKSYYNELKSEGSLEW